jgi:hypothetical protein
MGLEFLLLQRPGKDNTEKKVAWAVQRRLVQFANWEVEKTLLEAERQRQLNKIIRDRKGAQAGLPTAGRSGVTPRSDVLMKAGRLGDALKEIKLNGGGLRLSPTAETDKVMEDKMGQQALPTWNTEETWQKIKGDAKFERFVVTPAMFRTCFSGLDKSRGPGLSGFSFGYMKDALDTVHRDELERLFAKVLTFVANGEVPSLLWPYWHGGKGGISGKDGKRLFVAGESLQRLAEKILVARYLENNRERLFHYNVGVGVRGSADWIAAWARRIRKDQGQREGLVIIEVDARNMFLEVVREKVFSILEKRAPPLFALVRHLTGPMFVEFFQGLRKRQLTKGVSVGAPSSSLIASVVEEVVLEEMSKWAATNNVWAEFLAFIDNVFIATTLVNAISILNELERVGRSYGLRYELRKDHPHKICLLNSKQGELDKLVKWAQKNKGFEVTAMLEEELMRNQSSAMVECFPPEKRGIVLAGVPVGTHEYHQWDWKRREKGAEQTASLLANGGVHPKEAVILLKKCVATKMAFIARLAPLKVVQEGSNKFDTLMITTLQQIVQFVGGSWAEDGKMRKWLQVTWGVGNLERTTYPAKMASMVSVWRNGSKAIPSEIAQFAVVFNQCVSRENGLTLESPAAIMKELSKWKKPQKAMCMKMRDKEKEDLENMLTDKENVLLKEVTAVDACLWRDRLCYEGVIQAKSGEKQFLSPDEYRYAARRVMLGANVQDLPREIANKLECGAVTATGRKCSEIVKEMHHPESCCITVRGANKHRGLQDALCTICANLEVEATVTNLQPRGDPLGKLKKHADIRINGLSPSAQGIVVDVANKTRFAIGAPADYLVREENKKTKYYLDHYGRGGERFVPFVTGAFGGWGGRCEEVMRLMAMKLHLKEGVPQKEGLKVVKTFIQCAVIREIARNGMLFLERHETLINQEYAKMMDRDLERRQAALAQARAREAEAASMAERVKRTVMTLNAVVRE